MAAGAQRDDLVTLEGLHAVKHALRFGADVTLIATADRAATLNLAAELAPDILPALKPLLQEVASPKALEVGGRPIATGVCGLAHRPPFDLQALLDTRAAPIVLLDRPRSLANVGASVRASAAAAVAGILTTGDQDPWHPVALRGSAGLHFAQPVAAAAIGALESSRPLVGFDAGGVAFRPMELPGDAIMVFGSERHGLTDAVRERCRAVVSLPMRRGVSSLNLATSVAAALMSWRIANGWPGGPPSP